MPLGAARPFHLADLQVCAENPGQLYIHAAWKVALLKGTKTTEQEKFQTTLRPGFRYDLRREKWGEDTRRIHREATNNVKSFQINGAGGGNRTHGLGIMRPSLYH